jgi:hypothetical protein
MSLIAFDRISGALFIILGVAILGVVLVNVSGLSAAVSITCTLGGFLSIVLGLFCYATD